MKSTKLILGLVLLTTACSTSSKQESLSSAEATERDVAGATPRYKYSGTFPEFYKALFNGFELSDDAKLMRPVMDHRQTLLTKNLFDTGVDANSTAINCATIMRIPHRTARGQCYFFNQKVFSGQQNIGDSNARFGRNTVVPTRAQTEIARRDLMEPNPRLISRELFTRKQGKMIPATTINILAGAWLQAQNHDWFSHGRNVTPNHPRASDPKVASAFEYINVPPVPGDDVFPNGMKAPRTRPDLSATPRKGYPVTFRNNVTHWWDASQIYGSDPETIQKVRTNPETGQLYPDGRIAVDEKARRLYYDQEGHPITGFFDNWWVGLELIHSLFAMEHNSVVRMLSIKYPQMSGDEKFQKARLIVAALIAKIHTVEWTPALLDNKVMHVGMYSNWYGVKSTLGNRESVVIRKLLGKFDPKLKHGISGLMGPNTLDLYNVPFSLTEEFVAVYRMHPLVPESVRIYDFTKKSVQSEIGVNETRDRNVPKLISTSTTATRDLLYSLGTDNPGAMTLHNFPTFMQNMKASRNTEGVPEVHMDLATLDVLRDRERMVPRYNEFRRQLHLKPIQTFSDLTSDKADVALLEKIYGGDVEKLDLLVGTLAENDRFKGFAFGNTPFYIFLVMASRRLMADPFFSDYFVPAVYTQEGLNWIKNNFMTDVIMRHYPELAPQFKGVTNAFQPWARQ